MEKASKATSRCYFCRRESKTTALGYSHGTFHPTRSFHRSRCAESQGRCFEEDGGCIQELQENDVGEVRQGWKEDTSIRGDTRESKCSLGRFREIQGFRIS